MKAYDHHMILLCLPSSSPGRPASSFCRRRQLRGAIHLCIHTEPESERSPSNCPWEAEQSAASFQHLPPRSQRAAAGREPRLRTQSCSRRHRARRWRCFWSVASGCLSRQRLPRPLFSAALSFWERAEALGGRNATSCPDVRLTVYHIIFCSA